MSNRKYCYELACDLGWAESAILSQFYYWLSKYADKPEKYRANFQDGKWWTYNSLRKWHSEQFNFMSFSSFTDPRDGKKGKIEKLREAGYLVKAEKDYNKRFRGKDKDKPNKKNTSWYTIDLQKLHNDFPYTIDDFPYLPIPNFADCTENPDNTCTEIPDRVCTEIPDKLFGNSRQGCMENPDTYTLNNTYTCKKNIVPYNSCSEEGNKEEVNNSEKKKSLSLNLQTVKRILETDGYYSQIAQRRKDLFLVFFGRYFEAYREYRGQEHPNVSEVSMKKAMDNVRVCEAHEHPEIIPLYFQSEFKPKENKDNLKYGKGLKQCDYRIYHFTTIGVLQGMLKQLGNNADDNQSERVSKPETVQADDERYKTESKPETVQHAEIETWYYEEPEEELPFM